MQVIARRTLAEFWAREPRSEAPLRAWFLFVSKAEWTGPADVQAALNSVDLVCDNRVIFDIGGNKYRIVARVSYRFKAVQI
jgi:mRNA interferase HigB